MQNDALLLQYVSSALIILSALLMLGGAVYLFRLAPRPGLRLAASGLLIHFLNNLLSFIIPWLVLPLLNLTIDRVIITSSLINLLSAFVTTLAWILVLIGMWRLGMAFWKEKSTLKPAA